jgi:hypothetical protein
VKLAAVVHDAGSAEVLLSYLFELNQEVSVVVEGPALSVLERYPKNWKIVPLESLLDTEFDVIFLGLSSPSNTDSVVLERFASQTTLLISFLDHWSFSLSDFENNGKFWLPDVFVVTDSEAFRLASICFPGVAIIEIPNPYLDRVLNEFQTIPKRNAHRKRILYVSEPLDPDKNLEFVKLLKAEGEIGLEEVAYRYFISTLEKANLYEHEIVIRPHPRQIVADFDAMYLSAHPRVSFSVNSNLIDDLRGTDVVVGVHSMALYVSVNLGIPTFCCLPPGAGNCAIRGIEMVYLRDFAR